MSEESPVVSTKYGPVRGIQKTAATAVEYYSFQRIPYAKPPVGELRFKDAEPPTSWAEPLDCSVQGPAGYQFSKLQNKIIGSEDCLHMNVFTKSVSSQKSTFGTYCSVIVMDMFSIAAR